MEDEVLEVIKGYVEHIVFRNEENGYTVFHLTNKDGELTCVGTFPYISEGEMLEVSGGIYESQCVWHAAASDFT